MQGRLTPQVGGRIQCFPRGRWADEFALASQAGLDCIEWIYDAYGEDINPLGTDAGTARMLALAEQHRVQVLSVCADWFMDWPLVRASAADLELRTAKLHWLMRRCRKLGANRIVVPFVDASRIEGEAECEGVAALLENVLPLAEETGVELHLESSLAPQRLGVLLDRLPHSMLKVNYDSGNSSSLGYAPALEFAEYGPRVGSVHIKDRVLRGGTVPLGEGDADLAALFSCLNATRYSGDIILQVARGVPGGEVEWARHNRALVLGHLRAFAHMAEERP
jgi:hexulose-6-phosphate isomerase